MNQTHEYYMHLALDLAESALGSTAPNPAVGCVIVKNDQIIGQGATASGGRPHAEIVALSQAGSEAHNATMYVTLEPCCHTGKSGACTKAIINARIKNLIIATKDTFKEVNGQGLKELAEAGINITYGVLESQAIELNRGFFMVQSNQRPFITLKLATSIDGKIATKNRISKWLTSETTRNYTNQLRSQYDAILTGIGTILSDDPLLTCRHHSAISTPIRIILDSKLRTPRTSKIAQTANLYQTWIYTRSQETIPNCTTIKCPESDQHLNLEFILKDLAERGITRLLVEAGSQLSTNFIKTNLVDELILVQAPIILGNDGLAAIEALELTSLNHSLRFTLQDIKRIEDDILIVYKHKGE